MTLPMIPRENRKGLLIVYTGSGKGKTTAAMGLAIRAAGYDWKVLMVQFIKGTREYGEMAGYKRLSPNFTLKWFGKGFVRLLGDDKPIEEHIEAAHTALQYVRDNLTADYDLIILDEVNNALKEGLLTVTEVMNVIHSRPPYLHLVLTGRGVPPEIVEAADLVTEMKDIKHPFQKGILAQPGVDY